MIMIFIDGLDGLEFLDYLESLEYLENLELLEIKGLWSSPETFYNIELSISQQVLPWWIRGWVVRC